MIYAQLYRIGDESNYWSFRFQSKNMFRETVELLDSVKNVRTSKYEYNWSWKRWTLVSKKISDVKKEHREYARNAKECNSPNDILTLIDRIHKMWDDHIPSVAT